MARVTVTRKVSAETGCSKPEDAATVVWVRLLVMSASLTLITEPGSGWSPSHSLRSFLDLARARGHSASVTKHRIKAWTLLNDSRRFFRMIRDCGKCQIIESGTFSLAYGRPVEPAREL
jgi:hypothetical protein